MSESIKQNGEHHESKQVMHEAQKRAKEVLNEAKKEAAKSEADHNKRLESIREEIERTSETSKHHKKQEASPDREPENTDTYWYSKEYRDLAYSQTLSKVRKHLSRSERVGSKIIHKPVIEKLSDIGDKTVARTSGVLFGSIFSFIASLTVYLVARRQGYDMTYAVFIWSFVGGFALGILTEFCYRGLKGLLSRS